MQMMFCDRMVMSAKAEDGSRRPEAESEIESKTETGLETESETQSKAEMEAKAEADTITESRIHRNIKPFSYRQRKQSMGYTDMNRDDGINEVESM